MEEPPCWNTCYIGDAGLGLVGRLDCDPQSKHMQGSQRRVCHVLRHPGKRQAACCRKLCGAECHEVLHLAAYAGWCKLSAS